MAAGEGAGGARVAVVPDPVGPSGRSQDLTEAGAVAGPPRGHADLAAEVARREAADAPRWVWAATDEVYPWLLDRGSGRPARCHDAKLVESLLLGREGRHGRPRSLGAAWARLHGLPEPEDAPEPGADDQPVLFAADRRHLPPGVDPLAALVEVHADQQRRTAGGEHPDRMRLLCAAESAGALAAVEMGRDGLPWSASVHDELLTGLLGPRPAGGARPALLGELALRIQQALGGRPVNPDSPAQMLPAFARAGVRLASTRSYELRGVDHPAAGLLLRYKELSRIHAAHGWAWRESWVRDGRFHPEYVVGGVVSGRWATRGGGALQIPRLLRAAVVADPGHRLVVADAGQLEPRVLAAMSADPGLVRAAAAGDDLYAALALDAFRGDRPRAKIGLLAAMYGQTSGEAGQLLAVMRRRFPAALALVESAARTGEAGGVVRSRLGRTSPAPSADRFLDEDADPGDGASTDRRAARSWGRFTRNFLIQASASDWALAMLAALRRRLAAIGPEPRLVFFQHDEVIVHAPRELAEPVRAAVEAAGDEARRLVFGATPVRFPLQTHAVRCYAEAK
ncbi:bifunctional 3'-5' exonuclease/DNA polymerase [Actinacidiphila sp. DG2A-62]|uniref:bifunctional 3'-5' exonuclease/DNA polymerase n=1 Tax=Actinacidiphila sp. DG2A-62 TaxID=3108821 RepID=UPI002DC021C1|nr:bifunctional 3'-5' exonuclease/DNA polymerase [Actinacidiphila sp. DG2A-62]MEC3998334.1 bifunctional 3'-5' exonuclease/DNA polymerase [Actinacidiphila sp. DG2A-62]